MDLRKVKRMPNCFQIISRQTGEIVDLKKVNEEIGEYLGVEPHPKYWVEDWHNSIGYLIACCSDCNLGSENLRKEVLEFCDTRQEYLVKLIKILDFMESKYTSRSWYEVGRRP